MTAIKWRTGAGGNWNLAGNWTPASIPGSSDDATIDATGTYVVTVSSAEAAKSLTVNDATATVDLTASLSLSGTLALNAGTVDLAYGGIINGGTIHAVAGILQANGGTLQGVTDQGTLDLSASGSRLYATGGLTLTGAGGTGPGMLLLTGSGSQLEIASAMTLDNATIDIGNANSDSVLELANSGGTLTLGSRLDLQQVGAYAEFYTLYVSDTIINQGTIAAGISGGDFYFNYGTLVNKGTIDVSADDTLDLRNAVLQNSGLVIVDDATLMLGAWTSTGGTIEIETGTLDLTGSLTTAQLKAIAMVDATVEIAGALDNTGATLSIGYGAPIESLILAGTITAGVIADPNGALIANGGTLSAVTYQGTLDMSPQSTRLTVTGGLTMTGAGGTGPGTVLLTGSYSRLYVASSTTLNNATIDIGAVNNWSYLEPSTSGVTLTLGPQLDLQQVGADAEVYQPYTGDALINQGTIAAAVSGGKFVIGYGTLTNQGTIAVSNGDSFDLTQLANFTNLSGTTLSGGTVTVGAGSVLQLANNATIGTDHADITLDGTGSVIESESTSTYKQVALDATLSTIAAGGTLALLDGRGFTAIANAGTFTDAGTLLLGGSTFAATALTLNGGTIAGMGTIAAPSPSWARRTRPVARSR